MPRNVGGVFSLPAGTAAVPNALNSSADVNSRFADLEAEQNLVRPVSAGGTGGANQADARAGLGLVIGTNVQAQNANLQAEAGLTGVADRVAYFTGAGAKALATLTAFGRTLIGGADATAVRTAIGAQPLDATLTSLAAVPLVANDLIVGTGADVAGRLAVGANGTVLTVVAGAPAYAAPAVWSVQTPVATTAGGTIDFTGIPAGAKSIRLYLMNVSLTGTDSYLVQLGTSGGFVVTGYVGTAHGFSASGVGSTNMSTGFFIGSLGATDQAVGILEADLVTGNFWMIKYQGRRGVSDTSLSTGSIDIAGTLTQLRLTRTGTNTFDNGTAAISWIL